MEETETGLFKGLTEIVDTHGMIVGCFAEARSGISVDNPNDRIQGIGEVQDSIRGRFGEHQASLEEIFPIVHDRGPTVP